MLWDYSKNDIMFSKPKQKSKPVIFFFSEALQIEEGADVLVSCNPITECAVLFLE